MLLFPFVKLVASGYRSLEKFSHCMNMFCLAENAYTNLNSNEIYKAYDSAAKASLKRAAGELQGPTLLPTNKRVKIDGSRQKRGHASLNGVVTAIVEYKCVDYQVLTKHCLDC